MTHGTVLDIIKVEVAVAVAVTITILVAATADEHRQSLQE